MRLTAHYVVRCDAAEIKAWAQAIAIEQSVEMPLSAITDRRVLGEIVGVVEDIAAIDRDRHAVRIALAAETTGNEPGQLLNMLFGNTSMHDAVMLRDADFPPEMLTAFAGPRQGIPGLRERAGALQRAMTCSALKPQGMSVTDLAKLAGRFAAGGLDFIKDDHGLADQPFSPFAERVPRIAQAVQQAAWTLGKTISYLPSLSGTLDNLRRQVQLARSEGLTGALIAPMVTGLASFHALRCEFPDMLFMAHPAMAGAQRIAPDFLLGTLFRLLGADATIFPNYGGRFGFTAEMCRAIADKARRPLGALLPAAPVPAGGMTPARVPEMLQTYGADTVLLIGGGLLAAGEHLVAETAAFQRQVEHYVYCKDTFQ